MTSKFEKKLCVFAVVFVALYIGAIAMTIHSRVTNEQKITKLESVGPVQGEADMMLAELLLPMLIFLTVTVCFIIVRKKRGKAVLALEASDEPSQSDSDHY
jgi:cytochrome bd-type quinol oxidase subunit 2